MNKNPEIFESKVPRYTEKFDPQNPNKEMIFELIRYIKDPEHPTSLESLNVVSIDWISINEIETKYGYKIKCLEVGFEPTIPHCSMASIIGLCIVKVLKQFLPTIFLRVNIINESHEHHKSINKQLNDKDRVFAAFENENILNILNECTNCI